MKTLPPGLSDHLSGEALTLCSCWQLELSDGSILGFTDHDRDLVFDGMLHEAATGFDAGAWEAATGLAPDSGGIAGALRSGRISEADIRARRYDDAVLRHYVVNWQTPTENLLMGVYRFSEIVREGEAFRAELQTSAARLDQSVGRRYEKRCSADLGDGSCGIDLAAMTVQGTILSVAPGGLLAIAGIDSHEPGWFTGGRLTFSDGPNAGHAVEISYHFVSAGSGQTHVSLWQEPPEAVVSGGVVLLSPGCDKAFSTCRDRFSNHLNFRGFPHLPDRDFTFSYASNSQNMDGGPLVD